LVYLSAYPSGPFLLSREFSISNLVSMQIHVGAVY
jgi:hypothetical protein